MLADVVAIIGKFLLSYNFGITPKIPPHVLLEFSFVVRPSILMTTVFYKAVILQGEI